MAGEAWLETWSWLNRRAGCVVDESCHARMIWRRQRPAGRCWNRRMDLDPVLGKTQRWGCRFPMSNWFRWLRLHRSGLSLVVVDCWRPWLVGLDMDRVRTPTRSSGVAFWVVSSWSQSRSIPYPRRARRSLERSPLLPSLWWGGFSVVLESINVWLQAETRLNIIIW